MKIVLVILYAMNLNGGEPIVVRNYAPENFAACQRTVDEHLWRSSLKLFCVKIYEVRSP